MDTKKMTETGRRLPWEFIEMLADYAHMTARTWLLANNAPAEIVELIDLGNLMQMYADWIRNNNLSDYSAAQLPESIADVTELIANLGGAFITPTGAMPARTSQVYWNCGKADSRVESQSD